jgi:flagellar assembly factor FliW
MPRLKAKYFGELEYLPDAEFEFPAGIPGFERETTFVFLQVPHAQPLVFMQSLRDPALCFICVPVHIVDPQYGLDLAPEDRAILDVPPEADIHIGSDALCLAIITVSENEDPTANLASPVVLSLRNRMGVQAMVRSSPDSLRHPLRAQEYPTLCS